MLLINVKNLFSVSKSSLTLFQELENSEYSEFVYQKRIRCTSETDDIKQLIRKQNENLIQKRRFRQSRSLFFYFTNLFQCLFSIISFPN